MNASKLIFNCWFGFLLFFFMMPAINLAQTRLAIRGKVQDASGEVLPGATIVLQETRQGTQSDEKGLFVFNQVHPGTYHVQVSMIGFKPVSKILLVNNPDIFLEFKLNPASFNLGEVTIEGKASEQEKLESAVLIQTVDEAYLSQNAGATLMNSLERLPGVSTINTGVGIAKPVIRGLSFNRVLVTDSGIKQEGQQWGSEHGLEIDQYNVELVEIVKGSASLMHGSDALGGVVRLLHPAAARPGQHEANLKTIFRSVNNTFGATAAAKGNYEGLTYRLRLTGLSYGDYKVPEEEFVYNRFTLPIHGYKLKNTAGREKHVALTVGVNKTWGYSHLTVTNFNQQVGIFSGAMGIPRAYHLTPDGSTRNLDLPSQDINHFKVIYNNNIHVGNNWLEVDLGYQNNRRRELSSAHAHGADPGNHSDVATHLALQTFTANMRYRWQQNARLEQTFGLQTQLQQNQIRGFEFLIPAYRSRQLGLFAVEKYRFSDQLILTGGLRADYAYLKATENQAPFYYQGELIGNLVQSPYLKRHFKGWSGSAGLSYQLTAYQNLKFNFGKTFRLPAAPELTANGMHHGTFRYEKGDPDLRPEQGYQFDLAWNYEQDRLQVTGSPFFNFYKNYIYLSPSGIFPTVKINGEIYPIAEAGQMYTFKQATALHTGGEATATYRVFPSLTAGISMEYVWAQNKDSQLPLPFTPPLSLQHDLTYRQESVLSFVTNLFATLNYGWYSRQYRVERNEAPTPGYGVLNLSMGFDVGQKSWLQCQFQIQNITNEKYLNHLSRYRILNLPEPGRNFVVSLVVPLLKSKTDS